jgi:leucyl aminopeptidase
VTTPLTVAIPEVVDLSVYDTIAFAVFSTQEGMEIPKGLPQEVEAASIPSILDASFASRHHFEAKVGQTLVVSQQQVGPTMLAVGCAEGEKPEQWRQAAASLVRQAVGARALFVLPALELPGVDALGEAVVTGAQLASYRFGVRTEEPESGLESLDLVVGSGLDAEHSALKRGIAAGAAVADAVCFARDLINEHPSSMTPTLLAERTEQRLAGSASVTSEVWGPARIEQEQLGGLLGVARGSTQEPRLVVASYEPAGVPSKHVVLVGKGVTFDSGGLSLKTAQGMTTMKTDMTGAAVVIAALSACPALEVSAKVTVIAPMTENMPGGAAIKPGDVLVARNGVTIEVLNTDAEGRLILADGLSLAVEQAPDAVIDVATLTGAAVVALGTGVGALLSNDDVLALQLEDSGTLAGEPLWRLPLVEDYEAHIKSDVADVKNVGVSGEAGTISAALFLQRFVGGLPWAHLDIAGPGRCEKPEGYLSKGGTAFSLRTLLSYLRSL